MNLILIAVISLGAIALVLAAILYVASKKFAVYEDPRIAQVGEVSLPYWLKTFLGRMLRASARK